MVGFLRDYFTNAGIHECLDQEEYRARAFSENALKRESELKHIATKRTFLSGARTISNIVSSICLYYLISSVLSYRGEDTTITNIMLGGSEALRLALHLDFKHQKREYETNFREFIEIIKRIKAFRMSSLEENANEKASEIEHRSTWWRNGEEPPYFNT